MPTIALQNTDIAAFPGAEGLGKGATGARGLNNVYFITTLAPTGNGSAAKAFADAEAAGGGWVIPRVAGEVQFDDFSYYVGNKSGGNSNISYPGQAAPYRGLQFMPVATTGNRKEFRITGSNWVLRHWKSTGADTGSMEADGLKVGHNNGSQPMENVMIDHCSIRGARSRTMSFSTKGGGTDYTPPTTFLRNISITNCLLADPIPLAPMQVIHFGENQTAISWLKNIYTNGKERNPLLNAVESRIELINNYFYNIWQSHSAYPRSQHDIIGNIWEKGPQNDFSGTDTIRVIDASINNSPDPEPYPGWRTDYDGPPVTKIFADDNFDNRKTGNIATLNTNAQNYRVGARINGGDYTPMSSGLVQGHVVVHAGAGVGSQQGRDAFDSGKINEINTYTGSRPTGAITSPDLTTGGAGAPYADTSNNGLSDAYEALNGGVGSVNIGDRPVTATLTDGVTIIDQTAVTPANRFSHGDIFFAELAGDWTNFAPAPVPPPGVNVDQNSGNVSGGGGAIDVSFGG